MQLKGMAFLKVRIMELPGQTSAARLTTAGVRALFVIIWGIYIWPLGVMDFCDPQTEERLGQLSRPVG